MDFIRQSDKTPASRTIRIYISYEFLELYGFNDIFVKQDMSNVFD